MQGDGNNIRGFEVELIENGVQYIIEKDDCIVCIMGTKPDTKQIVNECTVDSNGYILIDITSQMSAVKGRGDYQIVLMSKKTNSQLKSFPFHILTTPATFDISYIISTDEFQLFTHKITQTSNVINNANKAISDIRALETSVENAEAGRVDAENERVSSENTRIANENIRIANEDTRNLNEVSRQSAETDRVNAENARTDSENIRIANEDIRISNESTRKSNEDDRITAESNRVDAEADRVDAEAERVKAEDTRISNENIRKSNESDRIDAESNRVDAENTRNSNETARQSNESTRQSNESTRQTNTATAITNADKATERAIKAAEACENIVSGTGIIMQTEKGAANGVASLDENCKIIRTQLPIADDTEPGGIIVGDNITIDNGIISISGENVTKALDFVPISQADTTTELVSSIEPSSESQNIGDFWLQEYN